MVTALASHQCGLGSNPGVEAICGLSLLLVLSFAPRGFSPGTPVFPLLKKQHFQIPIRSGTYGHVSTSSCELLSASWVNKLQQITNLQKRTEQRQYVGLWDQARACARYRAGWWRSVENLRATEREEMR